MEKLLIRESERTKGNIHIIKMFLIFFTVVNKKKTNNFNNVK